MFETTMLHQGVFLENSLTLYGLCKHPRDPSTPRFRSCEPETSWRRCAQDDSRSTITHDIARIGHRGQPLVNLFTISSATASARAAICCGVWSWIGCCTYTASKPARPKAPAWTRAGAVNSVVATGTAGMPRFSR